MRNKKWDIKCNKIQKALWTVFPNSSSAIAKGGNHAIYLIFSLEWQCLLEERWHFNNLSSLLIFLSISQLLVVSTPSQYRWGRRKVRPAGQAENLYRASWLEVNRGENVRDRITDLTGWSACGTFLTSGFSFSNFFSLHYSPRLISSLQVMRYCSCPRTKSFGVDFISFGDGPDLIPGGLFRFRSFHWPHLQLKGRSPATP